MKALRIATFPVYCYKTPYLPFNILFGDKRGSMSVSVRPMRMSMLATNIINH